MNKIVIFIVGPTAVGKTQAAACLAKKINAEIISCDSMQIYKGMDIITSKPVLELRKRVRHHLIDILSPTKEYNVWRYRRDALKKIKEILSKKRIPLFVGGTGLYMAILLDGIFKEGKKIKGFRESLYKESEVKGVLFLYERLKKIDPTAAAKIHPHDTKRIIRALEVFQNTGKPISYLQKQRKGISADYDVRAFCLNMKREELYKRIDRRVDKMFAQGLAEEVRGLLKKKLSRTASFAIGIRELKGYFKGEYDLDEARRLIKRNSRLYAKRQWTWFRKDKRIHWIGVSDRDKPERIAAEIWKELYS